MPRGFRHYVGEEIGDEVELVPTGDVVQEALEIDDGGLGVGIEIAKERGCLGDGSVMGENEQQNQRGEEETQIRRSANG